jgi:hypothetical protein
MFLVPSFLTKFAIKRIDLVNSGAFKTSSSFPFVNLLGRFPLLRRVLLSFPHVVPFCSRRVIFKTIMMLHPSSFSAFVLLLGIVARLSHFTLATDPLNETYFLVGPEPQPVVFGNRDSPLDSTGNSLNGSSLLSDEIYMPIPCFPVPDASKGGRKRNVRRTRHSTDPGLFSQSIRPENIWKPAAATQSYRLEEDYTKTESAPRSLQRDVCSVTNTFLSFQFDDNMVENGANENLPNPSGAAGLSRLVGVVSSLMEVRKKDGSLMLKAGFRSFFSIYSGASEVGTRFFDPKVIYDEHMGRFVIVVLQKGDSTQVSRIWLAVSNGETPDKVSDWYRFGFDAVETESVTGNKIWADFPGLEVDEEAVYITTNMYRFSDVGYVGARLYWFSKDVDNGFYAGKGFSLLRINPFVSLGVASTTMPAQVHGVGGAEGSVGTFLATVVPYSNGRIDLQIYTLFNPLGSSTYSIQGVPLGIIDKGSSALPLAPQRGTAEKIATVDARVLDAVWRDSKLWVVFTVNPLYGIDQGQATVHWVRLSTTGGLVVTIEAQGNLGGEFVAPGTYTYYPSVAVNRRGEVAYGYGASSSTTYAGSYVSTSLSDQSYSVKSGLAPYVRKDDGGLNQWGLYSGISADPADDSFWVFNQYASTVGSVDSAGDGRWGTAWGRLACSV